MGYHYEKQGEAKTTGAHHCVIALQNILEILFTEGERSCFFWSLNLPITKAILAI
jgi:hypothetical protein